MKLVKTKKVEKVVEEIEVKVGSYFFARAFKHEDPYEFYKVIIHESNTNNDHVDYTLEKVRDSYEDYSISYKKDYSDYLGLTVESYFKKDDFLEDEELFDISEETFSAVKEKIKKLL